MQKKAKMMNDKTGGHRGHRHIRFCASRTAAEWTDSRCLLITPMSNSNGICDLLSASIISSALQLTLFFYPGVFFHKPQIPPLHLVSFMEGLIWYSALVSRFMKTSMIMFRRKECQLIFTEFTPKPRSSVIHFTSLIYIYSSGKWIKNRWSSTNLRFMS